MHNYILMEFYSVSLRVHPLQIMHYRVRENFMENPKSWVVVG